MNFMTPFCCEACTSHDAQIVHREYRDARKIPLNVEHRMMLGMAPDYDHLMVIQKVEVFEHALDSTSGMGCSEAIFVPNLEMMCAGCKVLRVTAAELSARVEMLIFLMLMFHMATTGLGHEGHKKAAL